MVGASASVNLALFCSGAGSPGWSRKKGRKTVVVVVVVGTGTGICWIAYPHGLVHRPLLGSDIWLTNNGNTGDLQ